MTDILALARQFKQAVINIVDQEGQPATLGTAGGTVYYNDGVSDHKDRVWVRMGAEEQVLVIAKSKKGLPDVAGLQVYVAKRYGSIYITDWEQNQWAAGQHDYDTRNVKVGDTAGIGRTGAYGDNVMIGYEAGADASNEGEYNVIIGSRSAPDLDTGSNNVVIGADAAGPYLGRPGLEGGSYNVVIGLTAGRAMLDGSRNVYIGERAGSDLTGSKNTCIGWYAGYRSGTGSNEYNVIVGAEAGYNSGSDYSVFLGFQAGGSEANDYRLHIGVASASHPLIYGEFDDVNLGLLDTKDMAGGVGVIAIANATTPPGSTPTGGGVLYVTGGALTYKGSSGTVTTLGVA